MSKRNTCLNVSSFFCVSLVFLDIDQEFKEQLVQLVPTLLSAENLVEKEIGGAKVTCRDLLQYFKVAQVFQ